MISPVSIIALISFIEKQSTDSTSSSCIDRLSNSEKKIECLEKLSFLLPGDSYPLQQLADIYLNELNDDAKAKFYQNKANDVKNNF